MTRFTRDSRLFEKVSICFTRVGGMLLLLMLRCRFALMVAYCAGRVLPFALVSRQLVLQHAAVLAIGRHLLRHGYAGGTYPATTRRLRM